MNGQSIEEKIRETKEFLLGAYTKRKLLGVEIQELDIQLSKEKEGKSFREYGAVLEPKLKKKVELVQELCSLKKEISAKQGLLKVLQEKQKRALDLIRVIIPDYNESGLYAEDVISDLLTLIRILVKKNNLRDSLADSELETIKKAEKFLKSQKW